MEQKPVYLFYSYAHEDEELRDELAGHLKIMERRGVIRSWHDRQIIPGQEWDEDIDHNLENADLILLLISSDFINSDYIWGHELESAMQRHEQQKVSVVPIMLRAVDIEGAPFAALQGLPKNFKPVTSWQNRDEAWTNVAKGIRKTVKEIQARYQDDTTMVPLFPTRDGATREGAMGWNNPRASVTRGGDDFHTKASVTSRTPEEELKSDRLLAKIVSAFSLNIEQAAQSRQSGQIDQQVTDESALELIDNPEQKRVLWVDDLPENNQYEIAALAKLQIEVVTVKSTQDALKQLAEDDEEFDLIISDWSRPETEIDAPSAGIHLLRVLRTRQYNMPVVFYHGVFHIDKRAARRKIALDEGAAGEEVTPDKLIALLAHVFSSSY